MREYLEILTVIMMTVLTVGVTGLVAAGGFVLYKIIKDEY
jgi:hypothetical protein